MVSKIIQLHLLTRCATKDVKSCNGLKFYTISAIVRLLLTKDSRVSGIMLPAAMRSTHKPGG